MKHLRTFKSFLNESVKETHEIVGQEMEYVIDALNFLSRGMGYEALKKACKGKISYTIFLRDLYGKPKNGMATSNVDIMADSPNPSMGIEEFIDVVNKVLTDNGYDKYKVEIKK